MTIAIRPFDVADTEDVVSLWQATGLTRPWNNPYQDISRKLSVQPELFLVAVDERAVVGSVMAGYDGHRGWLYYLASAPERRGEGIGRRLVGEAEDRLLAMGCPKVQLMVRPENGVARGRSAAADLEPGAVDRLLRAPRRPEARLPPAQGDLVPDRVGGEDRVSEPPFDQRLDAGVGVDLDDRSDANAPRGGG